jgi:hypothetical protein
VRFVKNAQNAFFTSPFSSSSVPSETMIDYGLVYLILAMSFAARQFARRDL